MLQCLNAVDGNLDNGQSAFRSCLTDLKLEAPNGLITLDDNRQAIGSTFISEVVELPDGNLANQMVKKVDNVTQTLGLSKASFDGLGLPSRETPECKTSY